MFVMLSVHTSTTVRERQAETVTKDVNVTTAAANNNLNLNLKSNNINCISTSHYKVVESNTSNNNCEIDKTIKRILPIIVDTSTILSPSALTSAQPAQISNKFLITELNNYRKPPTVQVSLKSLVIKNLIKIYSLNH